ncbi:unnamed protein product [Rotaria sp. Silwood2]|nr:unnamed protein product [Rotaria sp. Silwood2]
MIKLLMTMNSSLKNKEDIVIEKSNNQSVPLTSSVTLNGKNYRICLKNQNVKNYSSEAKQHERIVVFCSNSLSYKLNQEQQEDAQQLKEITTWSQFVPDIPDSDLPYKLSIDASKFDYGTVLKQETKNGKINIIHYLSHVLSKSEFRYSTTELEALSMKTRNGHLDRWSTEILSDIILQELNIRKIRIKRSGKLNIIPSSNEVMILVSIDYWGLIHRHTTRAKSRYDRNRSDPKCSICDLVLMPAINQTSTFEENHEGPYQVIHQISPSTFIVKVEDPCDDDNPNYIKQVINADMKYVFS